MSAPTLDTVNRPAAWSVGEIRDLVRSEFRKTRSTSTWWALLIPAAVISLLLAWNSAKEGYLAANLAQALDFAILFATLFGALYATAEYRHNTIVTSYLNAARRPKLAVAQMILAALVGVVYGLVSVVAGFGGLLLSRTGFDGDLPWVLTVSAGSLPLFALWAVVGVGVGMLLRSQAVAVLAVLLYTMLIENVAVYLASDSPVLDKITDYLPRVATAYALSGFTGGEQFGGTFGVAHAWWLMLLVVAGYAAVAMLVGIAAVRRRDLT